MPKHPRHPQPSSSDLLDEVEDEDEELLLEELLLEELVLDEVAGGRYAFLGSLSQLFVVARGVDLGGVYGLVVVFVCALVVVGWLLTVGAGMVGAGGVAGLGVGTTGGWLLTVGAGMVGTGGVAGLGMGTVVGWLLTVGDGMVGAGTTGG